MELFLEFLFTISLCFVLSFIIAKLLPLPSSIDQQLESVSRSCIEVTDKTEKYVLEYEKGLVFVSEVVKVDALGEPVEEKDTLEECLNDTYGSTKISEETNETTEIGLAEDDEEEIEVLECEIEDGEDCLKKGLSDEDDDWEGIERNELEKDFGAAVSFLECRDNGDQTLKLDYNVKRQLYGLHKIATEGPCHEFNFSALAKWNAWRRLGKMSPETAMEQYISLLSRSIPGWMQNDVYEEYFTGFKASWKLPLDAKTMAAKQAITADYYRY